MRIYNAEERLALMIQDRRALHRIPEHAYDLFKTRAYLRERLAALEPDEMESCDEGIKVVFRSNAPKLTAIALSTRCMCASSSFPMCSRNRRLSMVRICSNKITESLLSPTLPPAMLMWVGRRAFPV